jgi:hypothetical protein
VAIFATLLAMPVQAENLVNIADSDNGDELFVDRDSMRTMPPLPEFRRFSAVQIWAVNQVKGGRRTPARTERFLFSFNCLARTSHILIYRNNRTGTKLQDWRAADLDYKYEAPRPGSLAEFSMMFACSGGRLPVVPRNTEDTESQSDDLEQP